MKTTIRTAAKVSMSRRPAQLRPVAPASKLTNREQIDLLGPVAKLESSVGNAAALLLLIVQQNASYTKQIGEDNTIGSDLRVLADTIIENLKTDLQAASAAVLAATSPKAAAQNGGAL